MKASGTATAAFPFQMKLIAYSLLDRVSQHSDTDFRIVTHEIIIVYLVKYFAVTAGGNSVILLQISGMRNI